MEFNSIDRAQLYGFIHTQNEQLLATLGQIEHALKNLQFEGKTSIGKNINFLERLVKGLSTQLSDHFSFHEQVLYPFFERYLPKLIPMIRILLSEHADLKNRFERMHELCDVLLERYPRDQSIISCVQEVQSLGTFIIFSLRNHIKMETETLLHVGISEIKEDEVLYLKSQVHAFGFEQRSA